VEREDPKVVSALQKITELDRRLYKYAYCLFQRQMREFGLDTNSKFHPAQGATVNISQPQPLSHQEETETAN